MKSYNSVASGGKYVNSCRQLVDKWIYGYRRSLLCVHATFRSNHSSIHSIVTRNISVRHRRLTHQYINVQLPHIPIPIGQAHQALSASSSPKKKHPIILWIYWSRFSLNLTNKYRKCKLKKSVNTYIAQCNHVCECYVKWKCNNNIIYIIIIMPIRS